MTTTDRSSLAAAAALLAKATTKDGRLDLHHRDGALHLHAAGPDTRAWISTAAEDGGGLHCSVNADLLANLLRRLDAAEVHLDHGPGGLRLRCGRATYDLPAARPDDGTPTLPPDGTGTTTTVEALRAATSHCLPAAGDPGGGLPVLGAFLATARSDGLHLAATDRYRLATAAAAGSGTPWQALPSAKHLAMLARALPDGPLRIAPLDHGAAVALIGDGAGAVLPCLGGQYPVEAVQRMLGFSSGDDAAECDAAALAAAVDRFRAAAGWSCGARIHVHDGVLHLSGSTSRAAGRDELPAEGGIDVELNAEWLADAVTPLRGGKVRLSAGPKGPVTIAAPGDGPRTLVQRLAKQ
jgi:hypothetical protein